MLPWIGPNWRDCSLLSDVEWIDNILKEKGKFFLDIVFWKKEIYATKIVFKKIRHFFTCVL